MILTAKTEGAFCVAAALPCSLPIGGWRVDVDPDMIELLDREDYIETSTMEERHAHPSAA
ncbi:hypothetical protein V1279_003001 [Bradyrhizobium sp. AZCC 1610]|uniref:hypothetical protein n=1 Tax=Bradyrhizobium sp. AZCC 1610 TaxID=3117020 RepID=UPI002FF392BB